MSDRKLFPQVTLLGALERADLDLLMGIAHELQVITGQLVVRAGEQPDAIYCVLEGLMDAMHPTLDEVLASFGAGESFAEMSFMQRMPASADVRARENSLLLAIPTAALEKLLAEKPEFAARLHRVIGATIAARLRNTNHRLERGRAPHSRASAPRGPWAGLFDTVASFKERLVEIDQLALKNGGVVPQSAETEVRAGFTALVKLLNDTFAATDDETTRTRMGARVQAELLPYLLLTELGERMYAKPRGYAGDYLTIANMYADKPAGTGRLGPLLDRCLRDQAAGQAVRNRRALLVEEIRSVLDATEGRARVTSLASGPAAELFDVYEGLEDASRLSATCIDIDLQALAHIADRVGPRLRSAIRLENANLVYLALGRTKLELPPQDLVYSIGLIDYFNDKFVVNLLDFIHDRLAPGGRCILGNFHPDNPTRALMDHVLDWPLIHRSEDDMNRLFSASKFGGPCERIRYEASGVNLFAVGVRRG